MLYCFKKGKIATETVTARTYQKWSAKFNAGEVRQDDHDAWGIDRLELTAVKLRHWKQSMLYHAGDRGHIQNIQITKVIGKNEKYVLFYIQKKLNGLLGQPNT